MHRMRLLGCVLVLGIAWAWAGCSGGGEADRTAAKETSPPPAQEADSTAATAAAVPATDSNAAVPSVSEPASESPQEPVPEPAPEEPAETATAATAPATVPAAETPAETASATEAPAQEAVPTEAPAATAPAAEPPAAAADDDLAGKVVAVPATKEGLTYVGAAKCKVCHKVQYASWEESAHAKRTPPLECEGCHGPGSEYKSLKIMKDPEAAKAAGLVIPDKTFCVQCHRTDWQDDMLARAHAHKGDAP